MNFVPDRLRRLCDALEERSEHAGDLEVLSKPDGAFDVRLTSPVGPVALMSLSEDSITVTTRPGGLYPTAADSEIVDSLGVDLSSGFRWDAVECESADELAYLLVKHLRRRVRDAYPELDVPR